MTKEFSPKGGSYVSSTNKLVKIKMIDDKDGSEAIFTLKAERIAMLKYNHKVDTGDTVLEVYMQGSSVRFICFDDIQDLHNMYDDLKEIFDAVDGFVDYEYDYTHAGGEKAYVLINNTHMSMYKRKQYETKTSFVFFVDALSNKSKGNTFSVLESRSVDVGSADDVRITNSLY